MMVVRRYMGKPRHTVRPGHHTQSFYINGVSNTEKDISSMVHQEKGTSRAHTAFPIELKQLSLPASIDLTSRIRRFGFIPVRDTAHTQNLSQVREDDNIGTHSVPEHLTPTVMPAHVHGSGQEAMLFSHMVQLYGFRSTAQDRSTSGGIFSEGRSTLRCTSVLYGR